MNRAAVIIIAGALLLPGWSPVRAAEKPPAGRAVAVYYIEGGGCVPDECRKSADAFAEELARDTSFKILTVAAAKGVARADTPAGSAPCNGRQCALDRAREAGADIAIALTFTGAIDSRPGHFTGKFLFRDRPRGELLLDADVMDTANGATEIRVQKTANSREDLRSAAAQAARRVMRRYRHINYLYADGYASDGLSGSPDDRDAIYGMSFGASYLLSTSPYTGLADRGYGAGVTFTRRNEGSAILLLLSLGVYAMNDSQRGLTTDELITASVHIGYTYIPRPPLSLTPFAGAGYILHLVNREDPAVAGDSNYTRKTYHDPAVTAGCELGVRFGGIYQVLFTPSYTLFFEKGSNGHFIDFALGARITF
jgi:hypothetical protein